MLYSAVYHNFTINTLLAQELLAGFSSSYCLTLLFQQEGGRRRKEEKEKEMKEKEKKKKKKEDACGVE